tara:strand:+ start:3640 stop:3804 length:165 start_codon:yes stop_codon:yes gene_type:complete
MKIKIEFTVDIDVDEWVLRYGTEHNEIRKDVKGKVREGVYEHFDSLGVLAERGE